MKPFVYDGEKFTDIEFKEGILEFLKTLITLNKEEIQEAIGEELDGRTRVPITSKDKSLVQHKWYPNDPNNPFKTAAEIVTISGIHVSQNSSVEVVIIFLMNFTKKARLT